jgi:predicted nucleic acid-binding protein
MHARYVLDASVAAKWFTRHDEPDREKAIALRALHQSGRCTLALPEFSLLEILNAVRYSKRAEEADAAAALRFLELLRLEIVPLDWELLRKANAISWTYQVALYDAAYVALAEREGFPLLTADEVMARKMRGHGIVLRLGEMKFESLDIS